MESRSSHFLVGIFVIAGFLLLAAMGVWFAKADIDQTYTQYDVVFTGSVNGLQEGAPVKLRGVPVGRVRSIAIDEANIEEIIATVEVYAGTPVKTDTTAILALQGITGLASIELEDGSQASPKLLPGDDEVRAKIQTKQSAIEQVFESTPELLASGVALMERFAVLLSPENLRSVQQILTSLEELTAQMSDPENGMGPLLVNATAAADAVGLTVTQARVQLAALDDAIAEIKSGTANFLGEGRLAMSEGQEAAAAVEELAVDLNRTFANLERPLDDFGQSGLYDFTEMVRELRQLVASMTRITKEFERDPTGFLIGGNQRGFTPE